MINISLLIQIQVLNTLHSVLISDCFFIVDESKFFPPLILFHCFKMSLKSDDLVAFASGSVLTVYVNDNGNHVDLVFFKTLIDWLLSGDIINIHIKMSHRYLVPNVTHLCIVIVDRDLYWLAFSALPSLKDSK